MFYVYLLQSEVRPDQRYIGFSTDIEARLMAHNAGDSSHTSKYRLADDRLFRVRGRTKDARLRVLFEVRIGKGVSEISASGDFNPLRSAACHMRCAV